MSISRDAVHGVARIVKQQTIAQGYREMRIAPVNSRPPIPGEFFSVLPVQYPSPMIRRPFAYSGWQDGEAAFIYEIRGRATGDMAELPDGAQLDWLGPLGTPFPMPPDGKRPILIAGGIGLGPLYYLATYLAENFSAHPVSNRSLAAAPVSLAIPPLFITGSREAVFIPQLTLPPEVEWLVCTDDGSVGIKGNVLNALNTIDKAELENAVLYTCGPLPMMSAVHQLALDFNCPCWVSMEEMMACAVGACQGCAVPIVETAVVDEAAVRNEIDPSRPVYKRVCVEGPVFNSREIKW